MSTSTLRFYIAMARNEGLIVERTETGKHYKLYVRNTAGQTGVITAPCTLSDNARGNRNKRSQMRRFAATGHV